MSGMARRVRRRGAPGFGGAGSSELDRKLVDLVRRMAGALVDAHHRLARRPGGEAEHLPRLGIEPRPLEMDALVPLDLEVALVCFLELVGGHPEEAGMHIHERRHANLPWDLATA